MGGETEVIVAIFKGIYFFLTAPYSEIQPVVERILHLVIIVFAIRWTWKRYMR